MGSGTAKGHAVHGATPFGLSIKAWPSEGLAVCQAVGTSPCEGLAARCSWAAIPDSGAPRRRHPAEAVAVPGIVLSLSLAVCRHSSRCP